MHTKKLTRPSAKHHSEQGQTLVMYTRHIDTLIDLSHLVDLGYGVDEVLIW